MRRGEAERGKRRAPFAGVLGILLLWTAWAVASAPSTAWGDGGTLRVSNVPMGAYRVNVFTDPTPIPPDTIDVSVLVTYERGRGVARGLDIVVFAHPVGDSTALIQKAATRDQAEDPRYYAAKFALGAVGEWVIGLRLEGDEGEGEVSFQVQVREPGVFGNPWVILAVALLPLVLVGFWLRRGGAGSHGEDPGRS